jgi:hypothetical protein
MSQKLRTRSVTGENQFCDPAEIVGHFNISISGTWVGTVTVQRTFDGGSTWFDVATWTDNTQEYGFEPERQVHYRAGMKLDEFVSGQADIRISQ